MVDKVMYSSDKSEWETPQDLFDNLNKEFQFTLDPAATPENAKCPTFYTIEDNGLALPWVGNVWLNPPYGRGITGQWVQKAYMESVEHHCLVCMLLPARTDQPWFHEFILNGAIEIRFIKGRLRFVGAKSGAPFPSMIVVFDGAVGMFPPHIYSCDKLGRYL